MIITHSYDLIMLLPFQNSTARLNTWTDWTHACSTYDIYCGTLFIFFFLLAECTNGPIRGIVFTVCYCRVVILSALT